MNESHRPGAPPASGPLHPVLALRGGVDVIGDLHGHAAALECLLKKMGYVPRGRGYRAPQGRQAIFVGDLIDRGSGQARVLEIVRAMVDSGDARCVLGNHEFNAIGYATDAPDGSGEALRPNRADTPKCAKNRRQHAAFLAAVGEGSARHREWIEWFRTLPLFLDLGGLRVVHASWHPASIEAVAPVYWDGAGRAMSDAFLYGAYVPGSALEAARKRLTCGLEWDLPDGHCILDKEGHEHGDCRIADWRHEARRLREVAIVPADQRHAVPDIALPEGMVQPVDGAPVLLGHHWFSGQPVIESPKLAVLDWSAAAGGPLVAYRWHGEAELSNDRLVWARPG